MNINHEPAHRRAGVVVLVAVAVAAAVGVAVIGGVRSFEAVSARFGSPLVPLTADGMIVACTALRLAALTRGWRLPGSLAITYVFIAGTIWLNVATATGWSDAIAHALAPAAYAVLVELLAHMLRLHLRLTRPRQPQVSALTWVTSPVITTRVWLHLARTGSDDPVAARALTQQVVRMRSRLRSVCPNGWHPFDGARPARAAALHTIRDGLLSAADVAALLPESDRLTPAELLARIDRAALDTHAMPTSAVQPADASPRTTLTVTEPAPVHTAAPAPEPAPECAPVHPSETASAAEPVHGTDSAPAADRQPNQRPNGVRGSGGRDDRSDEELVAVLLAHSAEHNDGAPLSQREARKVLGVGFPKARRLVELAGWTDAAAGTDQRDKPTESETFETEREAETEGLRREMSEAR